MMEAKRVMDEGVKYVSGFVANTEPTCDETLLRLDQMTLENRSLNERLSSVEQGSGQRGDRGGDRRPPLRAASYMRRT